MGTINHTPDPVQGAAVDVAGVIVLPDDNEDPKGDNIQLGDEQLADWIAYLKTRLIIAEQLSIRGIKTLTSGPSTETVYYTDATAMGPAAPSSDIVAEIDKVDVPDGVRVRVGRKDAGMSGRSLVVKNGVSGSTIATIAAGDIGWCEAEFDGTDWVVTAWGGTITVV